MCGLTGFFQQHGPGFETQVDCVQRMANTLVHRGPDDGGVWVDNETGIALAHRRLSVLDLSPAGHQPMISASGRYVIAFNGEIYNHQHLRASLEKVGAGMTALDQWRGHSDTETLLAGFDAWGIRTTIERCIGMFAISVWDRKERVLTLGRDRLGEKPLYYGWQGGNFIFGSELKALKAHPSFQAPIHRDALCLFMRHNYIPAPHSIYKGIYKLPPGHLLKVSAERPEPVIEAYWSFNNIAESGCRSPLVGSDRDVTDELERLLKSAIHQQMMADVPLGAFLSGGIDSSTLVALMQAQSDRPIKTFTIGFNEEGYNEALHAKAVARHLGTDHTELYVTPQQALDVIPHLPSLYCEPFADSSQIPTFLVSQLARQHVTVSLSGDAGDELFSGYNRYVLGNNLWRKLSRVPVGLRAVAATGIRTLSPSTWSSIARPFQSLAPYTSPLVNIGDKLHKGAGVLAAKRIDDLYLGLLTHWNPEEIVLNGREPSTYLNGSPPPLAGLGDVQRMMALDAMTYLPDDILVKVDRAAMGVSLESRVPFLDHRVVEFAWRIPQSMKLRGGVGKWILREVLYRHVPKELMERPKMGFGVPIDVWLRGPLREWAEELLDESRLRREGFFNAAPIRKKWAEHLSGKRNWQYHLWDVLMFQSWLEAQNN